MKHRPRPGWMAVLGAVEMQTPGPAPWEPRKLLFQLTLKILIGSQAGVRQTMGLEDPEWAHTQGARQRVTPQRRPPL